MKARAWLAIFGTWVAYGTGCSTLYELDKYSVDEGATSPGTGSPPEGGPGSDGGVLPADAQPGGDACSWQGTPTGAGSCTGAICLPFDNAARIQGFANDASLPALPEAGPSATTSASDGAADAAVAGEASGDSAATGGGDSGAQADATSTQAQLPACSSLPSPVYVVGSTGLGTLAAELGQLTATVPLTLVFAAAKSCDGAKAIIQNQSALSLGLTTASYWDVTGTVHTCQLDSASQYADIGLGQLFPEACLTLPQGTPGVGDFLGPVTPIDLVVPTTSTQRSISAEALYYTVGLGTGAVPPWTDPSVVFYNPGSGPQYDVALSIGVPIGQWIGTTVATAPQNIAKVGTSSEPEKTLGMMGADLVEAASNTSLLKALAYQDVGQSCGYYPNITSTSSEKQNVRDGHYPLWGFSHMFARVDAQDVPLNPTVAALIGYFTGDQSTPTGDFLKFVINDHLVPVCAMQVTRETEMGRLLPFTPSPGCGCYFDSLTQGSSTCEVCQADADCPAAAPHCNIGFCEVN